MSDDQAQERTEEATPKRKQESKDKGQVARSKELTTAIVMLIASSSLFILGDGAMAKVIGLLEDSFAISRAEAFDINFMLSNLGSAMSSMLWMLLPLFCVLVVVSIGAGSLIGGLSFSGKSLAPKYERMAFLKGVKRMFSLKALMELAKALAKFGLILSVGMLLLYTQAQKIFHLSNGEITGAIAMTGSILVWSFFLLCLVLLIIAAVDVPFQIFQHDKQIKMTMQEVKDEMKNTDGNPEIKSKIRQMQREIAQNKMMSEVPKADVILTNPTHYAVAIKYDRDGTGAPLVVAKGVDTIAFHIQKVARAHDVEILEVPPLARSIYHTTEINEEIPRGLYVAVAQILAYIYQLKRFKRRSGAKPKHFGTLPIPDDLQY